METRIIRKEEKSKYIDKISYLYYPQYKENNKWMYFYNDKGEEPLASCTIKEAIEYIDELSSGQLIFITK